jgi:hypothetical protein
MSVTFPVRTSQGGVWRNERIYCDRRGEWITFVGARNRFGRRLPPTNLQRWSIGKQPCKFRNGQTIDFLRVDPPCGRNAPLVLVLYLPHLEEADRNRNPEEADGGGNSRPPQVQVAGQAPYQTLAELKVAHPNLTKGFCTYWHRRTTRVRGDGEPALRGDKEVSSEQKRGPNEVWYWCVEDIERILRGEESAVSGTGRPLAQALQRRERDTAALEFLRALLANGPVPGDVVVEKATSAGMSMGSLHRAAKALHVQKIRPSRVVFDAPGGPAGEPGDYVSAEQAADLADCHIHHIHHLCRNGFIACERRGGKEVWPHLPSLMAYVENRGSSRACSWCLLGKSRPRIPGPTPSRAASPARAATAAQPPVVLGTPDDRPIVLGKQKPLLSPATYDVVLALLNAGEEGLGKDDLDAKSRRTEARKYLKALAAKDADWKAVIHFPGRSWKRYRISRPVQ